MSAEPGSPSALPTPARDLDADLRVLSDPASDLRPAARETDPVMVVIWLLLAILTAAGFILLI